MQGGEVARLREQLASAEQRVAELGQESKAAKQDAIEANEALGTVIDKSVAFGLSAG